jgi:hypothetical protein
MSKIDDVDEVQFRQINPSWLEDDGPSRLAFLPTKKDDGKLSLDRSSTTTAKDAFEDFKALGLNSSGVYGLTPDEFSKQPSPVECHGSPLENNPHHSHADFSELSNGQRKAKSQELRRLAIARGKLHP